VLDRHGLRTACEEDVLLRVAAPETVFHLGGSSHSLHATATACSRAAVGLSRTSWVLAGKRVSVPRHQMQ